MPRKLIVTIDGPSGAGKSTLAHLLAQRLGYRYLDTGAIYRVVALKVTREHIDQEDEEALKKLCRNLDVAFKQEVDTLRIFLEGEDVTQEIRTAEMGLLASRLSAKKTVREALFALQRKLANGGGVVVEGRDMGTVVFPEAEVKFYLDASLEVRGRRRYKQYLEKGQEYEFAQVIQEIEKRDLDDSRRALSPLRPAKDAIVIDSSKMSIEEVVEGMLKEIDHYLFSSSR